MTQPTILDEAGADYRLARVSWRDAKDEPWHSVTDFALKPAGEIRSVIAHGLATGILKHKFYRLDHGKPLPKAEAIPGQDNDGEDTTMGKLGNAVGEGVKGLKGAKAPKAAKVAKTKETKPKAAKPKADKPKSKKQPGVIAHIHAQVEGAKTGITVTTILDSLCKAFPDRKRESMLNTVRVQLGRLAKEKRIVVEPAPEGEKEKRYHGKS